MSASFKFSHYCTNVSSCPKGLGTVMLITIIIYTHTVVKHKRQARSMPNNEVLRALLNLRWDTASAQATSMVAEGEWVGLRTEDLDPQRHMTAEQSREKLSLHLSQCSILLYGLLCLSATSDAILL